MGITQHADSLRRRLRVCVCTVVFTALNLDRQTGFPVSSRSDLGTPGGVGGAGDLHLLFPTVGPRSPRQALNRQFTERREEGQGAGAGPLHWDLHELVWRQHCFTGSSPEPLSHRGESKSAGATDLPQVMQCCLPGP